MKQAEAAEGRAQGRGDGSGPGPASPRRRLGLARGREREREWERAGQRHRRPAEARLRDTASKEARQKSCYVFIAWLKNKITIFIALFITAARIPAACPQNLVSLLPRVSS